MQHIAEGSVALRENQELKIVLLELGIESGGEPFRYERAWSYLQGVSLIAQINEVDLSRWLKLVPDESNKLRVFFEHLKTLNSGIKYLAREVSLSRDNAPYFIDTLLTKTLAIKNFQLYRQTLLLKGTRDIEVKFDKEVDSVASAHINLFRVFGHDDDYWKTTVFSGLAPEELDFEASLHVLKQVIYELRSLYKTQKRGDHYDASVETRNNEEYIPTPDVAFAAQSYRDYMKYVHDKTGKMIRRRFT